MLYAAARLPREGELCTVCPPAQHKRAALLFDRLFVPTGEFSYVSTPQEITFGDDLGEDHPDWELWLRYGLNVYAYTEKGMLGFDRYVATHYVNQGIKVVPGYSSSKSFASDFKDSGNTLAYQAVLANLPVIAESVDWDQILEFREDKDSFLKSRRLRNWLRTGINTSSLSEATDIIGQMVDDYASAIRKHGMRTASGGLTLFTAALGTSLASAGAGLVESLAAGVGIAAGTVAWLIKRHCDLDDIERGKNSEIAIIYDAVQRFDQKAAGEA